jgi:hypothetical protein
MRDVMRSNGGFCASGGPYVIAQHCSHSDIALTLGGIGGIMIAGLVLVVTVNGLTGSGAGLGLAMWAALFGVLGFNFMDLGLFHPPHHQGSSTGWIVCGVTFWLMALGGLIPALSRPVAWVRRGGGPEPSPQAALPPIVRAVRPPGG